ncbi:cytochrome c oxidase subunit II [Occallatibacter riparius]|uniref:Cytochrome aa3 subunit 2 n=1 Tax=Occallatibacter riparius TaxID=1002689 RepID=A0A9J7BUX1_9BACT|nr:cytochrome c oxidase subunit II [Occallatibacter riparius]UWZ86676.1 cytochrome c oxidase subunit II [Occallatibacter riparius]
MPRRVLSVFATAAMLVALAGCHTVQSTFDPHGPAAERISHLSLFMTVLFLVITAIMWLLFAIAFYKRRGDLTEHAPIDTGGGEMWIAVGGIAIPLIVLSVLFVWGLALLRAFPIHGMHGGPSHAMMAHSMKPAILIVGHQWWWEIHYLSDDPSMEVTTANELHLPVGKPVNIRLETRDIMHSFWVPALHGKVDLIPGQPNYLRIEAAQPGEYQGQCAEYCGAEHARMRILAIAQTPNEYEAWLAGQRQPGNEPATEAAKAGQKIFLAGPCSMCHTVRGTQAGGNVAPDLTHIGSRQMIAANYYRNNDAYLEAWITHAQSLKPQTQMPNLTHFTGEQLADLTAYLRQLQ